MNGSSGAGWLPGALAYTAGLTASALFDWPAGPAIVVALATTALIAGNMPRLAASMRQRYYPTPAP